MTLGFVIPGLVRTEPSFMRYRRMKEMLRQTVRATPIFAGARSASAIFATSAILATRVSAKDITSRFSSSEKPPLFQSAGPV